MRRDDYSVLPKYLTCESNSSLAHLWIRAKAQKIMVSLLSCGELSCMGLDIIYRLHLSLLLSLRVLLAPAIPSQNIEALF